MSRLLYLTIILAMTIIGCVYGVMAEPILPTPQYYLTPRPEIQMEVWCRDGRLRLWTQDRRHGLLFCEELTTPVPEPDFQMYYFPIIGG